MKKDVDPAGVYNTISELLGGGGGGSLLWFALICVVYILLTDKYSRWDFPPKTVVIKKKEKETGIWCLTLNVFTNKFTMGTQLY